MGPVLAWHKENKRGKLRGFFISLAILIVGMAIILTFQGDGPFDWMVSWQVWTAILVGSYLMTSPFTYVVFSAGADWLKVDMVRFGRLKRSIFVRLYELRTIKAKPEPVGITFELIDRKGDGVDGAIHEFQKDPLIWDLVYNGILHSVAAGAEVNAFARQQLRLDDVRELQYPRGPRAIDLTRLPDHEVRRIMEDPIMRELLRVIEEPDMTPAQFRDKFQELREDMLSDPADPAWLVGEPLEADYSDRSSYPDRFS
ncbi:MAG: hypothetical protein GEU97_18420 [Actinophytocola sp.]|nr:hypothetical protein [Actinophytocola sp.]